MHVPSPDGITYCSVVFARFVPCFLRSEPVCLFLPLLPFGDVVFLRFGTRATFTFIAGDVAKLLDEIGIAVDKEAELRSFRNIDKIC